MVKIKSGLALLITLILSGCGTIGTGLATGPRSMEAVIISHTSELGKALERQYRLNLENVYTSLKASHNYLEVDFLPEGIGFVHNRAQPLDDSNCYLGLQIGTAMVFNTLQTDFNRRAATVFSKYGQEFFGIAMAQKEVMDDPKIKGVLVAMTWGARNFLESQYYGGTAESVEIIASKEDCKEFISLQISNQEFLRRSWVFGAQGNTQLGRIELDLKQIL